MSTLACDLVYIPIQAEPFIYHSKWIENMTVADLIQKSGLLQKYPEVQNLQAGIFSRCVTWDTLIKPGDRVELYRPLLCDPKEKRRKKAKR